MDFGLIVYQFHKLWWAVYFKEERKPYFQALDCKYVYLCVYSWDVYIFFRGGVYLYYFTEVFIN